MQVSTLSSWGSVAYTSWYGCGVYLDDHYPANEPSMEKADHHLLYRREPVSIAKTDFGDFRGFVCTGSPKGKPMEVGFLLAVFIVITAW